MSEWTADQPVVFVPCPGQPRCPDELFGVDGHRHFMRPRRKVWVRRVVAGCWEVWCPCCLSAPVVAQVSSWGRAMVRAADHAAAPRHAGVVLSSADEQPPMGTVVRDDLGRSWVNDGCYPVCWVRVGATVHDPESWGKVAGNYGPVTVIKWGEESE